MEMDEREADCVIGLVKFKRIYKSKTLYNKMYKYKTPFQLRVLWAVFEITSYPSSSSRESIAILLNISIRSVQIWFQNARQSRRIGKNNHVARKDAIFVDIVTTMLLEIYFKEL
ncbi:Homeobox protein HD-4 [Nosema bombycis CQ1]|jgi:hypothetical protein|uniref:Homeobox protein HD-4 n=1 Tax=Nosema bombycis (strain CQ1 / CVCC 102059) TaxID=578461 RepID=R0MDE3_NOSB1|nr:Homeobox protein HD-4 [Nosema bombycis CQ1]EOB14479.1 Homeobox protein HD-4 [Nosema bombycis CQ1]|eukprot:EOB12095.1 Homeobox protein HD-4 [Nosema bombycis CQ1]